MSNAEYIFANADFSGDSNLKNRLRAKLFGNRDPAAFLQDSRNITVLPGKKNASVRGLSLDELDMVSAAGDITYMGKNSLDKKSLSADNVLDTAKNPLSEKPDPFNQ